MIDNFTRTDFAKLLAILGMNIGVEIGVFEGWYSRVLLDANPKLKLYCIDPWQPMPEYGDMEIAYETTIRYLDKTNAQIIRKTSLDSLQQFEDNSIDFVYIDGDHALEAATNDIVNWEKKVRCGGIVSGHDYEDYWTPFAKQYRVKEAVNKFVEDNNISPWFIFDGRADYSKGKKRIPKSWMWVKK